MILARALVLVLLGLGLAACSDDEGSASGTTEAAAGFNDTDIVFAAQMLPHHEHGVAMAMLAIDKADDPAVRELAQGIADTQRAEIDVLDGFLDEYGAQPHTPAPEIRELQERGAMRLQTLNGAAFDEAFLRMMSAHHVQAVAEANFELEGGIDADAQALAEQIVQTQLEEIAEMGMLLEQVAS